ncbi:hypothetical protein [Aliiroseovarius subalbicans]|uniref:hypothetical protein n=1 Tax=Aliiroseovarius subalbicans TaxID=2925840 RepID=UPI003083FCFA
MTPSWRTGLLICLAVASASPLRAGSETVLFQPGGAVVGGAKPLLAMHPAATNAAVPHSAASLFTGQSGASLFAPLPARPSRAAARAAARAADAQARTVAAAAQVTLSAPQSLPALTQIQRLRHLIAQAEAGAKGYDAVQHGAKIKPDTPPHADESPGHL